MMTVHDTIDAQQAEDVPIRSTLNAHILGQLESLGKASGEDLVGQLARIFVADADTQLLEMREALGDGDADAVARSAHNLSGASATLGATDLASLCATLESESKEGSLANGVLLLEAVELELGLVQSAFASRATVSVLESDFLTQLEAS